MNTNPRERDFEHDVIQWLVKEAMRAGMESPLRDAILAAVEETTDEAETASSEELSTKDGESQKKSNHQSDTGPHRLRGDVRRIVRLA